MGWQQVFMMVVGALFLTGRAGGHVCVCGWVRWGGEQAVMVVE